uniref:Sushi domain containing 1 n=1 Tax=Poecilia formosa TaxID=48698 RepID=A0A096M298_POEFO
MDVCATCHPNATCEDKPDGSGKVCNCNYGFVGNGRTHCQDKDECQIGASKICGQHTTCHNTYGSYYCTCLSGYRPSNNMAVFIPNDGTHCRDIDECKITGQCGEGGQCRNLEGSFDCSCQIGYKVHNGAEPFRPQRGGAACKVVDCGPPVLVEDSVLLSITFTTYGGVARFGCEEGFVWRRGDNSSVCGADGSWSESSLVCEEILCGNPPLIEFTEQVWSSSSSPGSTVLYLCTEGFHSNGGHNVSVCGKNGQWTSPTLSCQVFLTADVLLWPEKISYWSICSNPINKETKHTNSLSSETLCGDPPVVPHTVQVWDGSFTPGSTAAYYCNLGFYHHEGSNVSVCADNGYWTVPGILCKEVDCGEPTSVPHAVMEWDNISTVGSKVVYRYVCILLRFYATDQDHMSSFQCALFTVCLPVVEISCRNPPVIEHANMQWDGTPHGGAVQLLICDAEIKPPVNQLTLYNGNCLKWKAEKFEEDTELYKVVYLGSRDYQRSFLDKGRRQLSSKGDRLIICLRLLPLTNYSISITAVAARFTATITANTSLTVPPAPVVHYTELETPVPTLRLKRSPNTLDPISFYQIFVLPVEELVVFDCSSPASLDPSSRAESPAEYLTAQLGVQSLGAEVNFTVGDGVLYGGFYNAPLQSGNTYFIVLRVVSRWKTMSRSCCVLWAKVAGTSYILRVSSLCAAASIAAVAMVLLAAYRLSWCVNRTQPFSAPLASVHSDKYNDSKLYIL